MRVLDVFSGTHSIGKVFEQAGHEVISVDLDSTFEPTHNVDVLTWDYKSVYPSGHFDYMHFSPPCIMYSSLSPCNYGRKITYKGKKVMWGREIHTQALEESDLLVKKSFEMMEYFKPRFWTMENPFHNSFCFLGKREIMKDIPYAVAGYCQYGVEYKKPTAFWNNFDLRLKACSHGKRYRHKQVISTLRHNLNRVGNLYSRYAIPIKLVRSIYRQVIATYNWHRLFELMVEKQQQQQQQEEDNNSSWSVWDTVMSVIY